jgi:NAD-dependent deacetylase
MTLSPTVESAIDRVVDWLQHAQRVLFITGAGLSADSGLPTYRGISGLYRDGTDAATGLRIEEILSGPMLGARPDLTWKYLMELERACRGANFNRGHEVIAEMERHFADVWTLTQNVDGFHRRAGSRKVIDIHGDLHVIVCTSPQCAYREEVEEFTYTNLPPYCPWCCGVLRPDVVLFEEMLPVEKELLLWGETQRGFDLVFSVGTSSLFPYISDPIYYAHDQGIPTVEINLGRTEISDVVDVQISAHAADVLDTLWARYRARGS